MSHTPASILILRETRTIRHTNVAHCALRNPSFPRAPPTAGLNFAEGNTPFL